MSTFESMVESAGDRFLAHAVTRYLVAADMPAVKDNRALNSLLRDLVEYPKEYGLTGIQGFTIQAVIDGVTHGIQTGRLPGKVEVWYRSLKPDKYLEMLDTLIAEVGIGAATGDYYDAFRKLGLKAVGLS